MKTINIDKDSKLIIDGDEKEITVNVNNCKVIITDISNASKTININSGDLDYSFIKTCDSQLTNNIKINNGNLILNVIDLDKVKTDDYYGFDLLDSDSNLDFSVASISRNNNLKNYVIKSVNDKPFTNVKIDCFGIVEDTSTLKYDVTSSINKGAKNSVVDQNSKILLFDKTSVGINNPILEIDENEVKANHGSSLGMIDEETLFYLTSRGIKEDDARKLVSMGRVNYIVEKIKDEKIKEELLKRV